MRRTMLTLSLLVALPSAARAQSLSPSAVHPAAQSESVTRMRVALRKLVMLQEKYWQQHGSYTTDMAALGTYSPDAPASSDSAWVQVIFAGSRGWTGMASMPSPRSTRATCVIFIGPVEDLPKLPQTRIEKKLPESEAASVCDSEKP
jgi:hypothetical protein